MRTIDKNWRQKIPKDIRRLVVRVIRKFEGSMLDAEADIEEEYPFECFDIGKVLWKALRPDEYAAASKSRFRTKEKAHGVARSQ